MSKGTKKEKPIIKCEDCGKNITNKPKYSTLGNNDLRCGDCYMLRCK